ncbi:MAG: tRNA epoxyqueuosine(34) reductase QueG [Candidatus Kerfeldbacteria bacterium]|nr:tRNA epoxyqueuosine(34) reductase QueG [Candidatus Kerfeldbacteria bacterium]
MLGVLEKIDHIFRAHHITQWALLPVSESTTAHHLDQWLAQNMHGTMQWMQREDTVRKRHDVHQIVPWARSIITCAIPYTPPVIPPELLSDRSRGIIARYALFDDYHDVLTQQLTHAAEALKKELGDFQYRVYVDTGPILEREWAQRGELGFFGRNSNLIDWSLGSYLFLCEIIVSIPLPEVKRKQIGSCGHCRACKDGCPTQAIIDDKIVDARKCISYLTIEYKGSIPEELRPLMKNRIYGCDICQEVCPWNRKPKSNEEWMHTLNLHRDRIAPPLESLLFFSDDDFKRWTLHSPMTRVKRECFMRNISVALGNWGTHDASLLLKDIVRLDTSPLVLEHAQWALSQCSG